VGLVELVVGNNYVVGLELEQADIVVEVVDTVGVVGIVVVGVVDTVAVGAVGIVVEVVGTAVVVVGIERIVLAYGYLDAFRGQLELDWGIGKRLNCRRMVSRKFRDHKSRYHHWDCPRLEHFLFS